MRVNTTVKLSDSDLIFLGGAAILGSMVREARSRKEAVRFIGDALRPLGLACWKHTKRNGNWAGSRRMADITAAVAGRSEAREEGEEAVGNGGAFRGKMRSCSKKPSEKTANGDTAHSER